MVLRVGILSAAHLHVWSYISGLKANERAELIGLWDDDAERRKEVSDKAGIRAFDNIKDLLKKVDAVVITSENSRHAELAVAAADAGKHILCEKPLVISEEQAKKMLEAVEKHKVKLMTAFPCRFSPAYLRLKERLQAGDIGKVRGICATNRGRCPFGWFVETEKSGGGAMIDHVVHVTDLLRDLLGEEVATVQAQTGNNMYGQSWDDTAMLTLQFKSGIFASLDSSWSRPQIYKTWGDVTLRVTGDKGVLEMDMFSQSLDVYDSDGHSLAGYGSDLDAAMIAAFVNCVLDDTPPPVTGWDGLQAARVALAGYESVGRDEPVAVSHHRL